MRRSHFLVLIAATLGVSGCGVGFNTSPGGGTAVKTRQPAASLEVPPDLMATTSEEITSAKAEQEALSSREVLPESYPTELVQDGDEVWLEIQASPQQVWKRVIDYWQGVGVGLVLNQPQTGTMETGWIQPERKPGTISALFAGLNDAGYDKYRVRLERAGDNETRLYVDHTWAQKILVTYPVKDPDSAWVETEDPEKALNLLKAVAFELDPDNHILGG